ncbi:MAG: hypothetical protein ACKVPX_03785, partial [Myxococcaceae bacterium]
MTTGVMDTRVRAAPAGQHLPLAFTAISQVQRAVEPRVTRGHRSKHAAVFLMLVLRKQGSSLLVILMDIQLQDSRLDSVALTRLVRGTLKDEPLPAYAMGCPVLSTPIFFVTAHTERFPEPGLLAAGGDRV